jgi:hypothetical protein
VQYILQEFAHTYPLKAHAERRAYFSDYSATSMHMFSSRMDFFPFACSETQNTYLTSLTYFKMQIQV